MAIAGILGVGLFLTGIADLTTMPRRHLAGVICNLAMSVFWLAGARAFYRGHWSRWLLFFSPLFALLAMGLNLESLG